MPKMKTNSAAKKRLRATGSGRIKRASAGKAHLMRGKSRARLRGLKKDRLVSKTHEKRVRRLIPYVF